MEKFFLFSFGIATSTLTDIIHFRQISQKYLSDILLRNTFRTFTYLHHLQTYEIGTKKCKLRFLATNSFFVVSHLYLYLLSTYLVRGPRKQKWRTTKNVSTQTLLFMFSKSINVSSNLSRYNISPLINFSSTTNKR